MNKPKILFLTLSDSDWIGLGEFFDVRYYNYKMPLDIFYERIKGVDLIIEQEFNDRKSLYSNLLENIKIPKAIWLIDRRGIFEQFPDYHKNYDFVFVAVDEIRDKLPRASTHLPLAYHFSLDLMTRTKQNRDNVLSFVGYIDWYPDRKIFFDKFRNDLSQKNISHSIKVTGWRGYADVIQDSYIGFNKSGADECNYRVYETMGFGAILLTDYNNECSKIESLLDRAYFYKDYDDIFNQIEKIKSIPKIGFEAIVKENQDWIKNNHLIIHRYLKIAEQVIGYESKK